MPTTKNGGPIIGREALAHPVVYVTGLRESSGNAGITYGDPYSTRSTAYDLGRNLGDFFARRG